MGRVGLGLVLGVIFEWFRLLVLLSIGQNECSMVGSISQAFYAAGATVDACLVR